MISFYPVPFPMVHTMRIFFRILWIAVLSYNVVFWKSAEAPGTTITEPLEPLVEKSSNQDVATHDSDNLSQRAFELFNQVNDGSLLINLLSSLLNIFVFGEGVHDYRVTEIIDSVYRGKRVLELPTGTLNVDYPNLETLQDPDKKDKSHVVGSSEAKRRSDVVDALTHINNAVSVVSDKYDRIVALRQVMIDYTNSLGTENGKEIDSIREKYLETVSHMLQIDIPDLLDTVAASGDLSFQRRILSTRMPEDIKSPETLKVANVLQEQEDLPIDPALYEGASNEEMKLQLETLLPNLNANLEWIDENKVRIDDYAVSLEEGFRRCQGHGIKAQLMCYTSHRMFSTLWYQKYREIMGYHKLMHHTKDLWNLLSQHLTNTLPNEAALGMNRRLSRLFHRLVIENTMMKKDNSTSIHFKYLGMYIAYIKKTYGQDPKGHAEDMEKLIAERIPITDRSLVFAARHLLHSIEGLREEQNNLSPMFANCSKDHIDIPDEKKPVFRHICATAAQIEAVIGKLISHCDAPEAELQRILNPNTWREETETERIYGLQKNEEANEALLKNIDILHIELRSIQELFLEYRSQGEELRYVISSTIIPSYKDEMVSYVMNLIIQGTRSTVKHYKTYSRLKESYDESIKMLNKLPIDRTKDGPPASWMEISYRFNSLKNRAEEVGLIFDTIVINRHLEERLYESLTYIKRNYLSSNFYKHTTSLVKLFFRYREDISSVMLLNQTIRKIRVVVNVFRKDVNALSSLVTEQIKSLNAVVTSPTEESQEPITDPVVLTEANSKPSKVERPSLPNLEEMYGIVTGFLSEMKLLTSFPFLSRKEAAGYNTSAEVTELSQKMLEMHKYIKKKLVEADETKVKIERILIANQTYRHLSKVLNDTASSEAEKSRAAKNMALISNAVEDEETIMKFLEKTHYAFLDDELLAELSQFAVFMGRFSHDFYPKARNTNEREESEPNRTQPTPDVPKTEIRLEQCERNVNSENEQCKPNAYGSSANFSGRWKLANGGGLSDWHLGACGIAAIAFFTSDFSIETI